MQQEELILKKLTHLEAMLGEQMLLVKDVLNFDEARRYLNFSASYLYKLTSKLGIPHYKPQGKMVYFLRAELDKWRLSNPVKTREEIQAAANSYVLGHKKSR